MREFGLIGYPLGHAYSAKYFENKFKELGIVDAKYTLFSISEISKVKNIISSHKNLVGLNVTTPYKELVIPYLHEMDSDILKLGTVNTIKILRSGDDVILRGYNTDVFGMDKTFDKLNLSMNTKALILGSGGSGKTVGYVLKNRNIEFKNISREPTHINQLAYRDITKATIENHKLIINATPVGMYPDIDKCPSIPYEYITDDHICVDLVYNPDETLFLRKSKEEGAKIVNGLTMLYEQADRAWEIWNK